MLQLKRHTLSLLSYPRVAVNLGEIGGSYRFFNLSRLFMFGTDSVGAKYNKIFKQTFIRLTCFLGGWHVVQTCCFLSLLEPIHIIMHRFAASHSLNLTPRDYVAVWRKIPVALSILVAHGEDF